jgi:inhibitor of cysteine peptidase
MKYIISLFAVVAMLIVAFAARPSKAAEKAIVLTDANNGKTVSIAAGKTFDVSLKGNPTTGYQWQIKKIEGDAIQQAGNDDYAPDSNPRGMVGSGGTFVFHFKVTKSAKTAIRLVYVRPWEKDTPPIQSFEVTIDSSNAAGE